MIFVSGFMMPETECYDDGVTVEILLSLNTDEPFKSLEVVMDDEIDSIIYLPVSTDWQQEKCRLLGLSAYIHGNNISLKIQSRRIGISLSPLATFRIKGDGNCFFRSLAQVLTGSQDDHEEVRLLVTSYMAHNSTIPELACFLDPNETMANKYLKQTRMQFLKVRATEIEIIAAASMLSTTIYCSSPSGATFKWLRHSPRMAACKMGEEESIYITNISNHFETVRKCNFRV